MFSTAINEADREELGGGGRGPCKERVGKGGAVSTALEQVYHGYAPGRCRPKDGLAPTGRYWIGVGGSCKVTGDKVGAVPTALVQVSHQRGTGESRPKDGLAFTGFGKVHMQDRLPGPMDQPLNWSLKVTTATTVFCRSFFCHHC